MDVRKLLLLFMTASLIFGLNSCQNELNSSDDAYSDYPVYKQNDLWPEYSPRKTVLKIWAPKAEKVRVNIYEKGHGENMIESYLMEPHRKGTWIVTLQGDYLGKYYTFQTQYDGRMLDPTPGIYATAVGVNGKRAMVVDLKQTNPDGWGSYERPAFQTPNDIVLYELHVRDMTSHPSSGSSFPGKYAGLTVQGTKNPQGMATGIDHMKELGITHVHLLPVFDYRTIDETQLNRPQFNWGYDPVNFNVPEGSYATNPFEAEVRIREFKEMVMAFHTNGIRVIMDVVYNHTHNEGNSNFDLEVPGYYYRTTADGKLSDASGCGNETASERAMMRKYIIESCKYWATQYHIDGFRIDLMGIHDIETINQLRAELTEIDPSIYIYGEGWTAGSSPLPDSLRALKKNMMHMPGVAAFSDDIRDGVKGHVFNLKSKGFVSGDTSLAETVKFGVVASTDHPQIDYTKIMYSKAAWASEPAQSIGYVSSHDNNTLFDKLTIACPDASLADIKRMHKLANAIVLTSQNVPFLHAGVELMRTKKGVENSYNQPDSVNQINWNWKTENEDIFSYYKSLIELRKAHPAFRMHTRDQIVKHLRFIETQSNSVVAFSINDYANGDSWKNILVVYNALPGEYKLQLPSGNWSVIAKGQWIASEGIEQVKDSVQVPAISMMVLFQ